MLHAVLPGVLPVAVLAACSRACRAHARRGSSVRRGVRSPQCTHVQGTRDPERAPDGGGTTLLREP